MSHRMLQAPTVEITRMLQSDIVVWLSEVREARASVWFNDTWTGERGNYTIANILSSGIKSNWRYMRRDVVGCAGATQRISLEVFTPSLIQYLSIRSKKHADKILCPKTGAHVFPSEATYIPSKIWKKIQDFKVTRLLLSYCEALQHVRKIWADDMDFFHSCGKEESFREAITRFRASGMTMKLARSTTGGILMPTKAMMRHVGVQKFASFDDEVTCVDECCSLYEGLYHRNGQFDAVEDKLTLTITMDVNIQGYCPCSGIRTWNFLMLNGLRSSRQRKQRRLPIRLLLWLRASRRRSICHWQGKNPKSCGMP